MFPFKKPEFSNGYFLLLNADPPVIYMKDWVFRKPEKGHAQQLRAIRGRPAYFLIQLSWTHEEPNILNDLVKRVAKYSRRNRQHELIVLANTQEERDLLAARGLQAVFCNGSAFLSADIFHPIPASKKSFEAVYDAVLSPYKRHYLASGISELALITYTKHDSTTEYVQSTIDILPRATWLNGKPDGELVLLGASEVNQCINRARAGLCLSAREGFMYASAQYLLAGLPIVTTQSTGGRDIFYDPAFVRTVDDDPDEVAAAVSELCDDPPPPESIRKATLSAFRPFRNRFVELMQDLLAGSDGLDLWKDGWPDGLPNKLEGTGISLQENLLALATPRQAPPWHLHGSDFKQQERHAILRDSGKVEHP